MSLGKQKRTLPPQRSLNAVVYCLIALAVVLSGVAAWSRYCQSPQSASSDAVAERLDALLPSPGIVEGWTPAGGPSSNTAAAPRFCFVCPQCQASCWTHARRGCPACPFCGLGMVAQGVDQQGLRISLVGGAGTGSATLPITIQADAVRPHGERGVCTNCHTVVRSGVSAIGQKSAGAVPANPQMLWQGVAAPAIPAGSVKPTLIEEFGMEVYPAQGAGVKVTGVMGNSYASNAGLRAGDVVIQCNGASVRGVEQFQQLVAKAPPEADAQITAMRNGRTRDFLVMVGEGEMEGFTPIQQP